MSTVKLVAIKKLKSSSALKTKEKPRMDFAREKVSLSSSAAWCSKKRRVRTLSPV